MNLELLAGFGVIFCGFAGTGPGNVKFLDDRRSSQLVSSGEIVLPEVVTELALNAEQQREVRLATQRIAVFTERYGAMALRLACYAAFPLTLTSELLYCLRENFADLAAVPWYAVADVLLSGLCQPIGHNLYEMPGAVRWQLLERLQAEGGAERIRELGDFMGHYIAMQLELAGKSDRDWSQVRLLGDRPQWTVLCCLEAGPVREAIVQEILRIGASATERERLHLSAMLESYGEMLPGEPIWLEWAAEVAEGKEITRLRQLDRFNVWQDFEFVVVTLDAQGQEKARHTRSARYFVEPLGAIDAPQVPCLEMVAIPGGEFWMGSPPGEGFNNEKPQHLVTVPPFFMGKYPVTQAQWQAVARLKRVEIDLAATPSRFTGDNLPVEMVGWQEAQEFCWRLTECAQRQDQGEDWIYRLPTEAEWEYACRAGTTTPFHFGETISAQFANCGGEQRESTPVGSFGVANDFGLYDMHGNAWEWCVDQWHKDYNGAPRDGSAWVDKSSESGSGRVIRGGSWYDLPRDCRSAYRFYNYFDNDFVGFRVVCCAPRTPT